MTSAKMKELQMEIQKCQKCPLGQKRRNAVPGEGSEPCNVLFLGEGPGEDEDECGRPCVGRPGKLLRQTINSSGLTARGARFFLTDLIKCHPPENRDPTPAEAEACWPWTREILKLTQPQVIVTLGRISLAYLAKRCGASKAIGSSKITDLVGKAIRIEKPKLIIYPCFHPTYIQRNSDLREQYNAHFQFLVMSLPSWTNPKELP